MASLLLRTAARHIHLENPVAECPFTRQRERWLAVSASAQDSAPPWLDEARMVRSQVARNIPNLL